MRSRKKLVATETPYGRLVETLALLNDDGRGQAAKWVRRREFMDSVFERIHVFTPRRWSLKTFWSYASGPVLVVTTYYLYSHYSDKYSILFNQTKLRNLAVEKGDYDKMSHILVDPVQWYYTAFNEMGLLPVLNLCLWFASLLQCYMYLFDDNYNALKERIPSGLRNLLFTFLLIDVALNKVGGAIKDSWSTTF